jgi:peroxiredoxin
MKKPVRTVITLALLVVAAGAIVLVSVLNSRAMMPVSEYPQAPQFELDKPSSNGTVKLSDFKGKVLVLFISTATCPVCRRQIVELKNVYPEYSQKNVAFINTVIAVTDQSGARMLDRDEVKEYAAEVALPFPVLLDSADRLKNLFSMVSVPQIIVIDQNSRLRLSRGFTRARDLSTVIDTVLAGKPVNTSSMDTEAG